MYATQGHHSTTPVWRRSPPGIHPVEVKTRALIGVAFATIAVAAPAFAQLPVPTVQVPPVPTVQVPPVPTVQVPVPTVQVPIPTVQVPIPTAAAPAPAPTSSAPQGAPPASSGSGGSSTGSGGGAASNSAGSNGAGSNSAGSAESGGGSSSSGGAASSRSDEPDSSSSRDRGSSARDKASRGPASPSRVDLARATPAERRAAKREQRLRETVTRARGCLDDLPSGQRRVLTLRAGVGAEPARSRTSVARRLDVSVRRVARLERAGLRKLRSLARGGGCGAPATTSSFVPHADTAPAAGNAVAAAPREREARKGRETKRRTPPVTGGVDTLPTPGGGGVQGATQSNAGTPGGVDLLLPLALLVMAALAVVVGRTVRRETAAAPEPVAPARTPHWDDPPPELRD